MWRGHVFRRKLPWWLAAAAAICAHLIVLSYWPRSALIQSPVHQQRTAPHPAPVAGRQAVVLTRATVAPASEPVRGTSPERLLASPYLPARSVDEPPLPNSAPELDAVPVTHLITSPIVLRVFIDQTGHVDDVQALSYQAQDDVLIAPLRDAFKATAFLPGRHQGLAVATFMDVEVAPDVSH
jgi:hypothetical protein